MLYSSEKLHSIIIRKEWRYLLGALFWVAITMMLITKEEVVSCYKLRPLVQSKLICVALVFLGREILFGAYRHRKLFKSLTLFFFLGVFGVHLIPLLKVFDGWRLGLTVLDTALWSMVIASGFEVAIVCYLYWYRIAPPSWVEYTSLWTRCWSEIVAWGLLITLAESLAYFYLINFFMMDTIFYSQLFAAFLILNGLGLFATFYAKTNKLVLAEVNAVDSKIQTYLLWRSTPWEDVEQFWPYFQWLLTLREYFNSFKRPKISLCSLLYYLIFTLFLLGLPYIFGAVIEV